jgi:hypothetical protein
MNVLCRHCFHLFDFRRVGVLCRSRSCSNVLNTEGRRGPRFMLPDKEKLWAQRGRQLALDRECPYCHERGRLVPACPRCRNPLDADIGMVEDRIIGVLGARSSGKTHYLAALLYLLLRKEIGGEVWKVSMDRDARQTAERQFLHPLFDDLAELPATSPGLGPELRLILTHKGDGRRVLLVFRDLSGEVMADRNRLEAVHFLRYAEGVVLLADPQALGEHSEAGQGIVTCAQILDNYRAVLEAHPRRREEEELAVLPERKFLAVTVTKADLVLRSNNAFWSLDGQTHLAPGFWLARTAESLAARTWLHKRLAAPDVFAQNVEEFADASYFFASSFGYKYAPRPGRKLRKPPQPLRVHEPIFALLDRFAAAADGARETPLSGRGVRRGREPKEDKDEDVL